MKNLVHYAFMLVISFLAVTTQSLSSVTLAQSSCSQNGSGTEMQLAVPNLTDDPLSIYWLDYTCNEQLSETIQPGGVFYATTYDGHEWVIRDANGQEVTRFVASTGTPTVVIGTDAYNPAPVTSNCSSGGTNQAIDLTVINNTDKPVLLNWIAFDCSELFYAVISGKDQFVQSTFVGNEWVVRFADGRVAKQIAMSPSETVVVIDPPPTTNNNQNNSTGNNPQPSTPADQERIAFVQYENEISQIYTMNPDGSDIVRLTETGTENLDPQFSPDGNRIVFFGIRDDDELEEIYVMNADGTNVQQITDNNEHDFHADFSPDGKLIVFVRERDEGNNTFNSDIYLMNADGTNEQRLTTDSAEDRFPRFSPDGTRIVFHSDRDGDFEIYTMSIDGTDVQQLTDNDTNDTFAAYSPDGSQIVFRSERDGNREIYLMNADGTEQQWLTNNTVEDSAPTFAPDGKILFTRIEQEGAAPDLYVMDANGRNVSRLTVGTKADWYAPR